MNFAHTIAHFFYPRHSNNQKAKILHSSSLIFFVLVLIFLQVFLRTIPLAGVKILGYAANIPPSEIITLTNKKRNEIGLSSLQYSSVLEEAARAKGEHMLANDYWSHVAPDGTEPWKFFVDSGYKYRYAGENLARDFSNPSAAIEAWMASPSHKDNMLSDKYVEIGVAVVEGDLAGVDTTIIVQLFGTKLGDTSAQVPVVQAKPETADEIAVTDLSPTLQPLVSDVSSDISSLHKANIENLADANQTKSSGIGVLISPFTTTRDVSMILITLLLVIMVVDAIIVSRRKISRTGGRTFAHFAFLGMILAIIIIAKAGQIL